jgi:hypothetical protein
MAQVLEDGPSVLTALLLPSWVLFFLRAFRFPQTFEPVLTGSAAGALPIGGKIFKNNPFGNFSLLVSPVRIVDITAGTGALALELIFVSAHSGNFLFLSFGTRNYNIILFEKLQKFFFPYALRSVRGLRPNFLLLPARGHPQGMGSILKIS